jgi:hypothetical protein
VSSTLLTGTVIAAVPSKFVPLIALAVCNAVAVPALPVTVVWSPVLVPLEAPEKFEADNAPAIVRAPAEVILFDEEKNWMSPVEPEAKVRVPVPFADSVNTSFVPDDKVVIASPPPEAADLICIPVTDDAVDASMLSAGFVVPFNPTANAFALADVIVCAPEVTDPVEVIAFACIAKVPPIVSPVRVPTEVMAVCAAPVTVAAVPDVFPVTLPVSGPENPVAVRRPVEGLNDSFVEATFAAALAPTVPVNSG